jgi:hypothetical protein
MTAVTVNPRTAPDPSNLVLGRGAIYFDRFVTNTSQRQGEFHMGNCTTFEVETKVETKEKYESMDHSSNLYQRGVTRQTTTLKITGDEFTPANLANALNGVVETISGTGASVTTEAITPAGGAILGAYYALAHRNITTLTDVKQASTVLVLGTDYTADLVRGRIYLLPTSVTITPGSQLTADYTYGNYSYPAVNLSQVGTVDGYIHFIPDNIKGPNWEAEYWHVQFTPSGNQGWIADDFGNWTLEGMVIIDPINHPTEPLGHLIQTS